MSKLESRFGGICLRLPSVFGHDLVTMDRSDPSLTQAIEDLHQVLSKETGAPEYALFGSGIGDSTPLGVTI